nr:hypothetical protein [Glycomyces tenuis]
MVEALLRETREPLGPALRDRALVGAVRVVEDDRRVLREPVGQQRQRRVPRLGAGVAGRAVDQEHVDPAGRDRLRVVPAPRPAVELHFDELGVDELGPVGETALAQLAAGEGGVVGVVLQSGHLAGAERAHRVGHDDGGGAGAAFHDAGVPVLHDRFVEEAQQFGTGGPVAHAGQGSVRVDVAVEREEVFELGVGGAGVGLRGLAILFGPLLERGEALGEHRLRLAQLLDGRRQLPHAVGEFVQRHTVGLRHHSLLERRRGPVATLLEHRPSRPPGRGTRAGAGGKPLALQRLGEVG